MLGSRRSKRSGPRSCISGSVEDSRKILSSSRRCFRCVCMLMGAGVVLWTFWQPFLLLNRAMSLLHSRKNGTDVIYMPSVFELSLSESKRAFILRNETRVAPPKFGQMSGIMNSIATKPAYISSESLSATTKVPVDVALDSSNGTSGTQMDIDTDTDHSSKSVCDQLCKWKSDAQHHQFFLPSDDIPSLTSYISKHAYMTLADIASDFETPASISSFAVQNCIGGSIASSGILIIYISSGYPRTRTIRRDLAFLHNLTIPHVIISHGTGQIWKKPEEKRAIEHPYLIRWFGTNQLHAPGDIPTDSVFHPKAYPLPLGVTSKLDSYEQLKYLVNVSTDRRSSSSSSSRPSFVNKTKLVLINFSPTGSAKTQYRNPPYQRFCNQTTLEEANAFTCTKGGFFDRVKKSQGIIVSKYNHKTWHSMAIPQYHEWALHKYTVSPRGQQSDCHRFWEALYLQSVPIVLRSELFYQDLVNNYFPKDVNITELPILFVDSWESVTIELLEREWKNRFERIILTLQNSWPPHYLTLAYIQDYIHRGVQEEVRQRSKEGGKNSIWSVLKQRLESGVPLWENRTRCYS